MKKIVYVRHGKTYKKLKRDEIIKVGAMHSIAGGELQPIMGTDTIGDVPANFSSERDFYNPTAYNPKE